MTTPSPNPVRRLFSRFANSGNDICISEADRKQNRIFNILYLYFTFVLVILAGLEIYTYYSILLPAGQPYVGRAWAYILLLAVLFAAVPGGWVIKNFTGQRILIANFSFVTALIVTGCYSIFLGPESYFHMFMFALLPLPFFFFELKDKTNLRFQLFLAIFNIVGFTVVAYAYPPIFPLPESVNDVSRVVVLISILFTISVCSFYFWNENQKAENNLRATYEQLSEKDRMAQYELGIAAEIQTDLLPPRSGRVAFIEYSYYYEPYGRVSGDYVDVIFLDGRTYVILADVSGHGVPAALITMLAKQSFQQGMKAGLEPVDLIKYANKDLNQKVSTPDYLTVFVICIDELYNMTYSNAAHLPAIYRRQDGGGALRYYSMDTPGMIVGALEDDRGKFQQRSMKVNRGDRLYLFTDGVTEQINRDWAQFEVDRLLEVLKKSESEDVATQVELVRQAVTSHRGEISPSDDITFLGLQLL